ncbi:MAG TPA: hypothetical protein VNT30_09410 [Stellaceae bacterium]|nr:hypothetical protein [Stellaceae bacterium]
MPAIPTFENQLAVPTNPGAPRADPAVFSQASTALARGAGQISDVAEQFNEKYQNAKRQADASDVSAQATQQLGDAQFRWSKVPDRDAAAAGFQSEAAQIKATTLARVNDPLTLSMVTQGIDHEVALRGIDTGNAAFGLEASTRRGNLDTNLNNLAQSAATATNDPLRAHITDTAMQTIHDSVAAGWLNPQDGADRVLSFKSQAAEVNARQDMNGDPAMAAAKLSDPTAYPGLMPERREVLQYRAEMRADRIDRATVAAQAHADAMAERDLRRAQSANEVTLLSQVYGGGQVDPKQLADLATSQQISPGGLEAVHSAMARQQAGTDSPLAVIDAYKRLGDGSLTAGDVHGLIINGAVKGTTGAELMRALNAQDKQSQSAIERGTYGQLKTALSGQAVEQGLFKDNEPQVVKWAQAQGEWTNRVTVNGEDPQAVLGDMLPRYQAASTSAPTWLPAPRFGAIANPTDLATIAVKTNQARDAGQIDQPTYDAQVDLLTRYKTFYDQQAAAATVRAPGAAKPKKPAEGGQ